MRILIIILIVLPQLVTGQARTTYCHGSLNGCAKSIIEEEYNASSKFLATFIYTFDTNCRLKTQEYFSDTTKESEYSIQYRYNEQNKITEERRNESSKLVYKIVYKYNEGNNLDSVTKYEGPDTTTAVEKKIYTYDDKKWKETVRYVRGKEVDRYGPVRLPDLDIKNMKIAPAVTDFTYKDTHYDHMHNWTTMVVSWRRNGKRHKVVKRTIVYY